MIDYRARLSHLYSEKGFVFSLSKKELKAKYSGAKLGIWWAFIMPALLAISINFIFTKAFKVDIPNYALFVLSAILPWLFFSQGLSEATNSFINNSSMLKQCIFSREIIPLSSILGNFLNFSFGLGVIIPVFAVFNYKILFLLPVLIISLILFLIFLWGLGLILSLMNVFYRDVSCFLSLGLMIWFWVTPIFYSPGMIAYPHRIICLINPVTYYMLTFRDLLYYGRIPWAFILIDFAIAFFTFFLGYSIFIWKEKELFKAL